jgi:hypothetical protein
LNRLVEHATGPAVVGLDVLSKLVEGPEEKSPHAAGMPPSE